MDGRAVRRTRARVGNVRAREMKVTMTRGRWMVRRRRRGDCERRRRWRRDACAAAFVAGGGAGGDGGEGIRIAEET